MADYVLTIGKQGEEVFTLPLVKFIWIAILALTVIAGIAAAIIFVHRRIRRTAPNPEAVDPSAGPEISIGKLHAQGKRASQQDSFFVSSVEMLPALGLLAVVGDGMGGLADGDRVSQTAVSAMADHFYNMKGEPMLLLLALLEHANRAVNNLLGSSGQNKSGSTLAAGLVKNDKFYYTSVGDSRICLYRSGILYQLNREHIFRNDLLLQSVNGEKTFQATVSDKSGAGLTSFLGMGKLKYVDIPACPIDILPGDRFILMSDGVYNALSDDELKVHLNKAPEDAAQCIGSAIESKGYASQDNYTAVILGC
jgi:serine/threonine protein phosphatase PrpC